MLFCLSGAWLGDCHKEHQHFKIYHHFTASDFEVYGTINFEVYETSELTHIIEQSCQLQTPNGD